ncbi:hypothetical protein UB44_16655 [Burkholderiaceae bacterium 26]|uniref:nuclear transport factor 2 family protein n=1 Tax=Ralstonia sp. Ralssp110 TaxID=3243004 RepID=UPI00061EBB9F|nr:hypothetical protein UB44_16655 [Burkholderiaceae bacterium 26]
MPTSLDPEALIRTYVRAKDENRPHLMPHAFAADATLQMTVKSEAISFPARSEGLAAIADVLVRRFGQTYDNVYTFCLTNSRPARDTTRYECDWLVGMSNKVDGNVRVGCGSYVWTFTLQERGWRVQTLDIVIDAMEVLPPDTTQAIFDDWLGQLAYPWNTALQALAQMPALVKLEPVRAYLHRRANDASDL